jgi:hypothetical protein
VPMAASQYPATATSASDRKAAGPAHASARTGSGTGTLCPPGHGACGALVHGYHLAGGAGAACLLAVTVPAFTGFRTRPGSCQPACQRRMPLALPRARPRTARPRSAVSSPWRSSVPSFGAHSHRGGARLLACHSAGRAPRARPASVSTGGVPAWV